MFSCGYQFACHQHFVCSFPKWQYNTDLIACMSYNCNFLSTTNLSPLKKSYKKEGSGKKYRYILIMLYLLLENENKVIESRTDFNPVFQNHTLVFFSMNDIEISDLKTCFPIY